MADQIPLAEYLRTKGERPPEKPPAEVVAEPPRDDFAKLAPPAGDTAPLTWAHPPDGSQPIADDAEARQRRHAALIARQKAAWEAERAGAIPKFQEMDLPALLHAMADRIEIFDKAVADEYGPQSLDPEAAAPVLVARARSVAPDMERAILTKITDAFDECSPYLISEADAIRRARKALGR